MWNLFDTVAVSCTASSTDDEIGNGIKIAKDEIKWWYHLFYYLYSNVPFEMFHLKFKSILYNLSSSMVNLARRTIGDGHFRSLKVNLIVLLSSKILIQNIYKTILDAHYSLLTVQYPYDRPYWRKWPWILDTSLFTLRSLSRVSTYQTLLIHML